MDSLNGALIGGLGGRAYDYLNPGSAQPPAALPPVAAKPSKPTPPVDDMPSFKSLVADVPTKKRDVPTPNVRGPIGDKPLYKAPEIPTEGFADAQAERDAALAAEKRKMEIDALQRGQTATEDSVRNSYGKALDPNYKPIDPAARARAIASVDSDQEATKRFLRETESQDAAARRSQNGLGDVMAAGSGGLMAAGAGTLAASRYLPQSARRYSLPAGMAMMGGGGAGLGSTMWNHTGTMGPETGIRGNGGLAASIPDLGEPIDHTPYNAASTVGAGLGLGGEAARLKGQQQMRGDTALNNVLGRQGGKPGPVRGGRAQMLGTAARNTGAATFSLSELMRLYNSLTAANGSLERIDQ